MGVYNMAHVVFNEFLHQLALQTINLATDTLRVALFPATYEADRDTHMYFSDIASQEIVADGYIAQGALLNNVTITKQDAADNVKVTADDVTWINSTISAKYAVIYKDTGTAASSPLIMCIDFGSTKSSVNGNFTIQWSEDGIFTISQAV